MKRGDAAILDECLRRLMQGESVAQCLEGYPGRAAELAPALEMAQQLLEGASRIAPEEEYRQRVRQKLLQIFAERRGQPVRRHWFSGFRPRLAVAGVAMTLILVVGLEAANEAAADSVPGEPLYWVKETRERVQLVMARSPEAKACLNTRLTEERVKEVSTMLLRGRAAELVGMERRFRNHLQQVLRSAGVYPGEAPRLGDLPPVRQRQLQQELSQLLSQHAQR